jgi:hypothetical protein
MLISLGLRFPAQRFAGKVADIQVLAVSRNAFKLVN